MKNQNSRDYQLKILNKIDHNYVKKSQSIYQLSNDKLVMPRYSKFILRNKHFFFGIPKNQFDKFKSNELFVLFICEDEKIVFILPANELFWLSNSLTANDHSWKLIIKENTDGFYLYKYGKDRTNKCISSYLNQFGLLDVAMAEKSNTLSKLEFFILSEEVTEYKKYYEGATTQIMVNIYERNPKARQECLANYGLDCCICGFNFEKVYGAVVKVLCKYITQSHYPKSKKNMKLIQSKTYVLYVLTVML